MSSIDVIVNLITRQNGAGVASAVRQTIHMLTGSTNGLSAANKRLIQAYEGVGVAALGAGAIFAGFATVTSMGIKDAGDLEANLVRLKIATQSGSDAMPYLTAAINDLAVKTIYGSNDATQAFERLIEMGFTSSQVMYGMKAPLDEYKQHAYDAKEATAGLGMQAMVMGQAMKTDAVSGAELLGSAIHTFRTEGLSASAVANDLAGAFFNGIPSASELQQAIEMAGAQANTSGIKFRDFLTVLDLLTQAGMSGSSAGASLSYAIQSMISPTAKQAKMMSDLGIITTNEATPAFRTFESQLRATHGATQEQIDLWEGSVTGLQDMFKAAQKVGLVPLDANFNQWAIKAGFLKNNLFDANGQFVGLKDAILILDKSMSGLSTEEKLAALGDMFNIRSGRAARVLTNIQEFTDRYDQIFKRIGNTDVTEAANEQLHTLQGAWDAFRDSLSSALAVALLPWLKYGSDFLNNLNDLIQRFQSLPDPVKKAAGGFLLAGTALSGLAFFVLSAATAIGLLSVGISAVAGVFIVLGPVLAAVGVGISEVALLAKVAADFWQEMNTKGTWANENLKPILDWFLARFRDFKDFIVTEALPTFKRLWDALEPIRGLLELLAKVYLVLLFGSWMLVIGVILLVIVAVTKLIEGLLWLKDRVGEVAKWVGEHWDQLWNDHLKPFFENIGKKIIDGKKDFDDLRDKIGEVKDKIVGWFKDIKDTWDKSLGPTFEDIKCTAIEVRNAVVKAWDEISGSTDQASKHISDTNRKTSKEMMSFWAAAATSLKIHFKHMVESSRTLSELRTNIRAIWLTIKQDAAKEWHEIRTQLDIYGQLIKNDATHNWSQLKQGVKLELLQLKADIKTEIRGIGVIVLTAWIGLKNDTKTLFGAVRLIVKFAWLNMKMDFAEGIASLEGLMIRFVHSIIDPIQGLAEGMRQAGANLIQGLINGITSMLPNIGGAVKSVAQIIKDNLGWHSPTKEGPGADSDTWAPNLMLMLARGITANRGLLYDASSLAAGDVARGLSSVNRAPLSVGSGGSGQPIHIHVHVGNDTIGEYVLDHIGSQLRPMGINRLGR